MPSSILDRVQRECSCGLHAALAPRSSHGATCGRFVGSHSAQIATARTHEWSSPDATAASCSRPRWAASADLLALYFRRWGATCLACANAGRRQAILVLQHKLSAVGSTLGEPAATGPQ